MGRATTPGGLGAPAAAGAPSTCALAALAWLLTAGCTPTAVIGDDDLVADDDDTHADDDDTHADDDDTHADDDDTTEPCDETQTWYADADGDGYGDPATATEYCVDTPPPPTWVLDGSDCHDDDDTAYPGSHATEIPGDGVDVDCDGLDACRDVNCDGWPDLVFAQTDLDGDYHTDSWIYLGSAAGFDPAQRWAVPTVGAMGVDAGDLDGDGYVDLVFASVQDGEEREIDSLVYYGGADGYGVDARAELPTIGCSDPTVADVDDDGWLDVVFSNRFRGGMPTPDNYTNDSYVYWGGPSGYSTARRMELPTFGAARSRVADLDGDGYREIVFANGVTELFFANESYLYWGSAAGWSEDDRTELPSVFPEGLAVDDIDGDGDVDVLLTSWMCLLSCGDASLIFHGDGAGGLDGGTQLDDAVGGTDAQVADLDRDGFPDLVIANGGVDLLGSFATESWIYPGSAAGFDVDARVALPTTAASECGVEDLDGDGWLDVVCASHYAPEDGGAEVSQVYWGSASGHGPGDVTELPTVHAAGMTIVGSIVP